MHDKSSLSINIYAGTCHPIYDQVMKRPDQVKVNRSGPVFVMHDSENIETICIVVQWLSYHTKIGLKMFVFISLYASGTGL